MNPYQPCFPTGDPSSSEKEPLLQFSHPSSLIVPKKRKVSHEIKKQQVPPPAAPAPQQREKPRIIYAIPPRVVTARSPSDFKKIVQRLTGLLPPKHENMSPAAVLTSIENTTSTENERNSSQRMTSSSILGEGVEVGPFPGILASEPDSLPPLNPNVFSPEWDPLASYCDEFWKMNE